MTEVRALGILSTFLLAGSAWGDIAQCACDAARPETLQARECSLCGEAEKQAGGVQAFLLKDINPRKPNRWLALPKAHGKVGHPLKEMSPAERTALWKTAIAKAKELWGEKWGLAYNGAIVRTQCHAHIHIGKLLDGVETGRVVTVNVPEEIPAPETDTGMWVHPAGKKLHVHLDEQITETVLLR